MSSRLEQIFDIISKHRQDVPSYDAYYLEGCEGCTWKPDREYDEGGQDTTWRQFHIHVAKEIEMLLQHLEEETDEKL